MSEHDGSDGKIEPMDAKDTGAADPAGAAASGGDARLPKGTRHLAWFSRVEPDPEQAKASGKPAVKRDTVIDAEFVPIPPRAGERVSASAEEPQEEPQSEGRSRSSRFAILAASVAAAAVLGSVLGSIATESFTSVLGAHPTATASADTRVLRESVALLGTQVASLKASVDAINRNTSTQFTKIGQRFDQIDRTQGEPNAKLGKIAEAVERLERRPAVPAATPAPAPIAAPAPPAVSAPETTASISEARPPAPDMKPLPRPPIVDGWIVRSVYRGHALVESRYGEFDVIPGSNLPALGRVEDVMRQDGRWVVVTPKGLITSLP